MDGGNEQRVAIKCCFRAGLYATETQVFVQMAYGNEALNGTHLLGGILDLEMVRSW
jgi:hypothetical protein